MARNLLYYLSNPYKLPRSVKWLGWPILWRILAIALLFQIFDWSEAFTTFWSGISGQSETYYALASVLGVMGGFSATSITIIGVSDSEVISEMKKNGGNGILVKMIWTVIFFMISALLVVILGADSPSQRASEWMFALASLSILETILLGIILYMGLVPNRKR